MIEKEIRNPGGYLQTLCNSLIVPDWYIPLAERLDRIERIELKKKADEKILQEQERQEQQYRSQLNSYWHSLSNAQRNSFVELVKSATPSLVIARGGTGGNRQGYSLGAIF